MLPMALGFGEGGDQSAPLGRAVIGGLVAATLATLFVLPAVFTILQKRASRASASLDATDPDSAHYVLPANDQCYGGDSIPCDGAWNKEDRSEFDCLEGDASSSPHSGASPLQLQA